MQIQPIEKMDAETKLKMKFVFDVIDYIGGNFHILVMDPQIGIGFNAALNDKDEPCLIMESGRSYPVTVGNLSTGRLQKLEPEMIHSHIVVEDRQEILNLKNFDFFQEKYYQLMELHFERTLQKLKERTAKVSEEVSK